MIDLTKAIISLHPEAKWSLDGSDYSGLQWLSEDITKPTEEELIQEHEKLEAEAMANAYRQQRAEAYAPYAEQLDMQYHDVQDGTETWLDHIKEVKDKYPKGDK